MVDATGEREHELPRETLRLGGGPGAAIPLPAEAGAAPIGAFKWDARRATWLLSRDGSVVGTVAVNGRLLGAGEEIALNHLDLIDVPGAFLQFQRIPAEPLRNGAPITEVLLTDATLTFGSGRETAPDPNRINLDPEDMSISRVHAVITREGRNFAIEDKSSHGTELNGIAFKREKLVFGDRFRISGYIFEFTGDAIRRIEPELAGSIVARNLVFTAGGRRILDDVSVHIAAGEFIGVLGRSGQGKSTLLNALCGVNPATEGEVRIGGVPLTDRARLRELGIGYVPQDDIVHRELTVVDAVTYSARLRLNLERHLIDSLVQRVLDRLGLMPHWQKRVAQLSGGQRKRVSIAIELLAKPTVLFLDEPSSGLDPATESELMTLLQSLTLTKLTVVCTTHVLHKAYLFDRMLVIEGGKLIFAGRGDEARLHFLFRESPEGTASLENAPLERIYTLMRDAEKSGKKNAADWEAEYRRSPFAHRACLPIPEGHVAPASTSPRRLKVNAFKTLAILAQRQWSILRADPLNLAFLAAQPLIIGFLVGWASDDSALRMFLCIVATMWFGCSNGAQQIVAELPIFRRERVCGQGLNAYIFSKLGFLSAISLVQALLLLVTTLCFARVFHGEKSDYAALVKDFTKRLTPVVAQSEPVEAAGGDFEVVDADNPQAAPPSRPAAAATPAPPRAPSPGAVRALVHVAEFFQITQNILDSGPRTLKRSDGNPVRDSAGREVILPGSSVSSVLATTLGLRLIAILAATLVSVGIGLAISSLVENTTQAVLWVPLVLIPQILFGGIVVAVPEMSRSVENFSQVMPSFAAQRIADVSALFGIDTPSMTNRTKTPLFLSSTGEKETVEWVDRGGERSQDYDKLSPVNTSWQNVTVLPGRLGQHKWEKKPIAGGGFFYPDSVESRRDVTLRKGMPFRDLTQYRKAAAILLAWLLVCYGVMLGGLISKQTGK